MKSITVIILTKNEEKNIEKAVNSARQIADRVIVVDSGSTDQTLTIAASNGAETYFHEWSTHARQFNWALDNCGINTEWIFRLDADERITPELADEILRLQDSGYDSYEMRWRLYFMGKWIKHGGTYKPYFLRLFRYGKGRVEDKVMDEHVRVEGKVGRLQGDLLHYDYKGLDAWLNKHVWYSQLELKLYRDAYECNNGLNGLQQKRGFYYKLPLFLRARLYYWYRYYIQLGFLDGTPGKIFIYLQAYWYRFLVDAKIYESMHSGEYNEKDSDSDGEISSWP